MKLKGPPPEPTNAEQDAIDRASDEAGEYLTTLGKTDVAQLEVDEWRELIQGICMAYAEQIQKRAVEDIPL